jgi:hypothetical protein
MPARPTPALALLALCALAALPSASASSTAGVDLQGDSALGLVRTALADNGVCDLVGGSGPMPAAQNVVQVVHDDKGVVKGAKEWVPNGGLATGRPTDPTATSSAAATAVPTPTLQGTWLVQALCSVLLDDPCLKETAVTVPCVLQSGSLPSWFGDVPGPFTLVGRSAVA